MGETEDRSGVRLEATSDPSADGGDGPSRARLGRGVEAARLLEATADLVRRARSHAKQSSKAKHRRKARRQLKKLIKALRSHQEQVLSQGLGPDDHEILREGLVDLDDTLQAFLDGKPKKKALQRVKKHAKRVRKDLLQ